MNVYRISRCAYIDDLSGTGALFYPGRWHNKGSAVLYTSSSASLALLESIVHITSVVKINMCMICLELPAAAPIKNVLLSELPADWLNNPPPEVLKNYGDQLVRDNKLLALRVPSAVMPEESNYILNTGHKDYHKIKIRYHRAIHIDERFFNAKK